MVRANQVRNYSKRASTYGTFKVSFSVVNVVGVFKEESSHAETSLDFDDWEEGDVALANGF